MYIIGDVHGLSSRYNQIVSKLDYSVQLGDMGFVYGDLPDPTHHKFFGGNHDNYDTISYCPNNLGDYGAAEVGGTPFFFVRGAFSIDLAFRIGRSPKSWWCREELTFQEMLSCLNLYKEIKPSLVITHTCPLAVANLIGDPSMLKRCGLDSSFVCQTSSLLQQMFEEHQPARWIFGHFHKSWDYNYSGTHFTCLNELEHIKL